MACILAVVGHEVEMRREIGVDGIQSSLSRIGSLAVSYDIRFC